MEKQPFKHWRSKLVARHTPHHSCFDQIVSEGEKIVLTGKFHYGDFRKDLEDEIIAIFKRPGGVTEWEKIGEAITCGDGRISFKLKKALPAGRYELKMVVVGDLTKAIGKLIVMPKEIDERWVIFDIDGTLTKNDGEAVKDYLRELRDGNYLQAAQHPGAKGMVEYYIRQNYRILYLTARPYWLDEISKKWLKHHNFPDGVVIGYNKGGLISGDKAANFKTKKLKALLKRGVQIDYAYGNAGSDITAYLNMKLTKEQIFIIGEHSKDPRITGINDYRVHLKRIQEQ